MTLTPENLCTILAVRYLHLTNEKALQDEIAARLDDCGVAYHKEAKVSGGAIDFLVGGIGVEVKIKGQRRAIYRQLEKYAEDENISHLILLTSIASPMPAEINGKPVTVLNIGGLWA